MSPTPRVSVCIAAWRSPRAHLQAALASALDQHEPVLEVLVGDDSPDDRLRAVVSAFGDQRVRYVHHRTTRGAAGNHAWLLAEARGRFVAILNHDDAWEPLFTAELSAALEREPQAVLAFCDHHVCDAAGQPLAAETYRNTAAWGRDRLAAGLHRPFMPLVVSQSIPLAMGTLMRRSALDGWLAGGWWRVAGPAYDLWIAYLLARGGGGAVYVPARLSRWRTHGNSLTAAANDDWLRGAARCWRVMAADPAFVAEHAAVHRKAASAWAACARHAARRGAFATLAHDASLALSHLRARPVGNAQPWRPRPADS